MRNDFKILTNEHNLPVIWFNVLMVVVIVKSGNCKSWNQCTEIQIANEHSGAHSNCFPNFQAPHNIYIYRWYSNHVASHIERRQEGEAVGPSITLLIRVLFISLIIWKSSQANTGEKPQLSLHSVQMWKQLLCFCFLSTPIFAWHRVEFCCFFFLSNIQHMHDEGTLNSYIW